MDTIVGNLQRKELVFRRIQFDQEQKLTAKSKELDLMPKGSILRARLCCQINGKDPTNPTSIAADAGSEGPRKLFLNSKAKQ
jgi:hypothetical protein